MASGEMSDAEFQAFLDKVLGLMTAWLVTGAVLFVFMDWRSIHRVYAAGDTAKLKLLNLTKKIQDLLSITKLLTVFETYESEDEAVRSYQS